MAFKVGIKEVLRAVFLSPRSYIMKTCVSRILLFAFEWISKLSVLVTTSFFKKNFIQSKFNPKSVR